MRSVRLTCALALALGCLAAAPAAAVAGTSVGVRSVMVAGDRAWTDTGIDVPSESEVDVLASGLIQIAESDSPGKSPDGDRACVGTGAFVALGLHCWALIGRIGENGKPVELGSGEDIEAGSGGRLYLGINDDFFADNRGVWLAGLRVSCQCVGYVKDRFGLTGAAGNAYQMGDFLLRNGFQRAATPAPGEVVVFQPSFSPHLTSAGHVAVLDTVTDLRNQWRITTVGANQPAQPERTEGNCDNVSTQPWASYPKSLDNVSVAYYVSGGTGR